MLAADRTKPMEPQIETMTPKTLEELEDQMYDAAEARTRAYDACLAAGGAADTIDAYFAAREVSLAAEAAYLTAIEVQEKEE